MRKTELDQRILKKLVEKNKGKITEHSIRNSLSRIRRKHLSLTLNAAAEVFAQKRGFSVSRYLTEKDRETLKTLTIEKVRVPSTRTRQKKKLIKIANYETEDKFLKKHILEINKAYTCGCYTATFVMCRKVLENLLVHHILKRKYPTASEQHRSKYWDFNRNRILDFSKILQNLRTSSNDFVSEKALVERICQLSDGFKEKANDMTHSRYHVATKKEIDDKNFQYLLDLIKSLETSF